MRIVKNSTTQMILSYLYYVGQGRYQHISLALDRNTENIKKSMQKLVRAEYVEKLDDSKLTSYAITEKGVKALSDFFHEDLIYKKPIRNLARLDKVSRNNYERFVIKYIQIHKQMHIGLYDNICLFKVQKFKRNLPIQMLEQVKGSSCSFALYEISNNVCNIFFVYFLYESSRVIQDKAELAMIEYVKHQISVNKNAALSFNIKFIFVFNSQDDIIDVLEYNKKCSDLKAVGKYGQSGFVRTHGKLSNESIIAGTNNKYLIISGNNVDETLFRILFVVKSKYDEAVNVWVANNNQKPVDSLDIMLISGLLYNYQEYYSYFRYNYTESCGRKYYLNNSRIFLAKSQNEFVERLSERYKDNYRNEVENNTIVIP